MRTPIVISRSICLRPSQYDIIESIEKTHSISRSEIIRLFAEYANNHPDIVRTMIEEVDGGLWRRGGVQPKRDGE